MQVKEEEFEYLGETFLVSYAVYLSGKIEVDGVEALSPCLDWETDEERGRLEWDVIEAFEEHYKAEQEEMRWAAAIDDYESEKDNFLRYGTWR